MVASRQDAAGFERMTAAASSEVAGLARAVRALILKVMPGAFEVVWGKQKTAGYGTGPKKQSEHFCWIALQKNWVNLGFNYGSELADPDGLLEGTGAKFRHVKVRSAEDARRPALRKLLVTAT